MFELIILFHLHLWPQIPNPQTHEQNPQHDYHHKYFHPSRTPHPYKLHFINQLLKKMKDFQPSKLRTKIFNLQEQKQEFSTSKNKNNNLHPPSFLNEQKNS